MNFVQIKPHLLFDFKDESDLLKAIEELSFKFTQNRENISDYLNDPRLTSAYTAFYLTTNIPKFEAILKWMPQEWVQGLRELSFIDVGAGPGTFSIAFRQWVNHRVSIRQIETSSLMAQQAKKLWLGLYPGEALVQGWSDHKKDAKEKLLFFGHSANEMSMDEVLKYVHDFSAENILFIEPGTKDFFPKMLLIRQRLIEEGYHILFPCPQETTCPMAGSQTDWCHQFIKVRQDPDVERLSQIARKDRRHLPLIVHAFSKRSYPLSTGVRIVRVLTETKFSFEWVVCESNVIKSFQIMKRNLSKESLKSLSEAMAGAWIEVEYEKILEDKVRVKLIRLNAEKF